jgi:hypothetical protein
MKKSLPFIGVLIALLVNVTNSSAQTKLIDNGPDGAKKVIVVMGDGYAAGADQTKYNNDVDRILTSGVFAKDFFAENHNAFNVYRLNLTSVDSGVSKRKYDEKGTADTSDDTIIPAEEKPKNTALKYIYTGQWSHCWMEGSPTTGFLTSEALRSIPKYDYVVIILNESGFGGCGGGGFQVITSGVGWDVMAHEFGHGIGGLWDEYVAGSTSYSGGPVNVPNCSTLLDRNAVHWNRFISPATALPTIFGTGMDSNRTVGMFEGCGTVAKGLYRPVSNCRMNGNTPPYCPVCYTHMKKLLLPYLGNNFSNAVAGDFNGDGRTDTLIHNGQDLSIFRSNGTSLSLVWTANNLVPAAVGGRTWQPAPKDQYFVADFNADGKDDVFVFNDGTDWGGWRYLGLFQSDGTGLKCVARYDNSIASFWTLAANDQFYVGDFDGDRKADLFVFNPGATARLGLLKSSGTALTGTVRYDGGSLPGWSLQAGDRYHVGDFDNDGKADLYVFNGTNWGSTKYLAMLKSSGTGLARTALYTNSLPGTPGWGFAASDQFYVGDFDGDRKADLYVFNGTNWGTTAYLCMAKSSGTGLSTVKRYDSVSTNTPGWAMRTGDRFFISDANKDGKADLFVHNPAVNWPTEYLGTLLSSGTALTGSYSADWVGGWNLSAGDTDKILVARYEGGVGKPDIFIRNNEWFGLLRRNSTGFVMDRIYYHWIYTALYDAKPWSDSMP